MALGAKLHRFPPRWLLPQLDLAQYGKPVLGLIVGGAVAAPLAGFLLRVLPIRVALIMVGIVVAVLSLVNLISLFF